MHKTVAESLALVDAICETLGSVADIEVGVAPPFGALGSVATRAKERSGGQLLVAVPVELREPLIAILRRH